MTKIPEGILRSHVAVLGKTGVANTPGATTRSQLREAARGMLAPQEQRMFDVIYDEYPRSIARKDMAERIGLSTTASTYGVYLSAIAGYGIIENAGPGMVKAAAWMFP